MGPLASLPYGQGWKDQRCADPQHSFYQVQFEAKESVDEVLQLTPLALRSVHAQIKPCFQGFDTSTNMAASFVPHEEQGFLEKVCFPSLRHEYLPFLPQIGQILGTYIEPPPHTAASVVP